MDLYREEILEHWRSPQNFGKLADADFVIDQINPLCGDQVTFYFRFAKRKPSSRAQAEGKTNGNVPFKIHDDTIIGNVSFTGKGCAISIASASILSEAILNKSVSSLSKITGRDVLKMIGGPVGPARLKCAFLSLEAVKKLAISH
mgnify:FL=1